jgi:putative DNA-binding protein
VTLAELQHHFATVATSTSGPPADIDAVFVGNARLTARERLGIYNRGYHARLLDALASVFTHTKRALGDADFERIGLAYLASHPSEHPAVERVGRRFPEYLRTLSALPSELADLATLEWARLRALVAANPRALERAHSIDAARFPYSRLHFVASLSIHTVDGRALSLFSGKIAASEQPSTPNSGSSDIELRSVAVWRRQHRTEHAVLAPLEATALALALSGASVSHCCELFDSGAPAADAQRAFRVVASWFEREWIEAVDGTSAGESELEAGSGVK